ncbi:MAG: hypothetical protein EA361_14385 [Bacteroidetes bacterium]|nr:MAG: hypothetical protein EA361_14385 [Bacteroidota bacterium]
MLKNKSKSRNLPQIFIVSLFLIIWSSALQGQSKINSPYSMFGPGEVKGSEYFRNMSMGGISQGFRSNVTVNYLNPASYTAIDSLSFVFDGTVFSHIYQQKVSNLEQTTGYTAMANINFAFPVTRRWSVAAGLLPWSQLGYNISDFQDDDAGRINYFYEGSGGISQVYMGHGFRLHKGLSAGVNISYLFGKAEDRLVAQSDSIGFHRTGWSYSDQVSGLMLSYGLQWQFPIDETRRLTLGATYTGSTGLDIQQSSFITRSLPGAPGIDTLNFKEGQKGKMEIPASIAAGVFMNINPRWSGGVDFQSQNWSSYKTFDSVHNLNDAYMLRAGAVFNPRVETYTGFFNRLEYRFGARYGQSFLTLQDRSGAYQDFSEFGISFGLGIPVRRSLSALNLGFEYSQRSSGSADLIQENYFRFNIGINVYERWFVRRKFY